MSVPKTVKRRAIKPVCQHLTGYWINRGVNFRCYDCGFVKNFLFEHIFVFHPFFMNNPGKFYVSEDRIFQ